MLCDLHFAEGAPTAGKKQAQKRQKQLFYSTPCPLGGGIQCI